MKIKNISRTWIMLSVFVLAVVLGGVIGGVVLAQTPPIEGGLVPCGNGSDPANRCTLCHLVLGIRDLIDYGFKIFVGLGLLMMVVGGVLYIVSAGDKGLIDTAKNIMKNTAYGFVFVLSGWLLVNFTIMLLGANVGIDTTDKTWDKFTCDATRSQMGNGNGDGRVNCTGSRPANAKACSTTNPTASTAISLVQACPSRATCEYACNDEYVFQGGACIEPVSGCIGNKPENAEPCSPSDNPNPAIKIKLVDACASAANQCLYKCKEGFSLKNNACVKSGAVEGEACGRYYKGTCRKTDDCLNYGAYSWSEGFECASGLGLKCCIGNNTKVGTCTGVESKKAGTCYSGPYNSTSCYSPGEIKDGQKCDFNTNGGWSEYKCCVPK